jgi:hypothetical protein
MMQLLERFRQWFRNWLGIKPELQLVDAQEHWTLCDDVKRLDSDLGACGERINQLQESFRTLDAGMTALNEKDLALERQIGESIQALQIQLTEFNRQLPKITIGPDPAEVEIMGGHRRFSDRKKDYEAKHRKPVLTETAKQIADNQRKIASGERKAPEK